jgi:hypothetical protein
MRRPVILNHDGLCWWCGQVEKVGLRCVNSGTIILRVKDWEYSAAGGTDLAGGGRDDGVALKGVTAFVEAWWRSSIESYGDDATYPALHPRNFRSSKMGEQKMLTVVAHRLQMRRLVHYTPRINEGELSPQWAGPNTNWKGLYNWEGAYTHDHCKILQTFGSQPHVQQLKACTTAPAGEWAPSAASAYSVLDPYIARLTLTCC